MRHDIFSPLSAEVLTRALDSCRLGPFGANTHYLAQVGSTNDVAKTLANEGAPEGTLVITDEQTAGRGRMGRRWLAPPNTALLVSLLFRPTLHATEANRLTMVVGLAAAEAIEAVTGLPVQVKWPNDLLVGGAKVAGILPESGLVGDELEYVVVGIGINVNMDEMPTETVEWAYPATSLLREMNRPVDRLALLCELLAHLNRWHRSLHAHKLDRAWTERMVTLGQQVTAEGLEGVAELVDRTGALWVRQQTGWLVRLTAGEATLRPPP
jgi:BirA family biotin operon repressor/biotin-[acetyl-CoA-carboxylase] ligase